MSGNTSATGGPLQPLPSPAPAPLEGIDLLTFLQGWIVGITGLPGDMVRPRWQAQAPVIPQAGTAWAALGIASRTADTYAYTRHNPTANGGLGEDDFQRHEMLDILTSFYDTGSTGQADYYAALLRDGIAIAQNRELLTQAGFGFTDYGDMTAVPVVIKGIWQYRVDFPMKIKRIIQRAYPVETVLSATDEIEATDGENLLIRDINVP